jgi:hypothetical protein
MNIFGQPTEEAEPLTIEGVQRMLDQLREEQYRRAVDLGNRLTAFYGSVPQRLHNHPAVAAMAGVIASDQPIHPADARRLRDALEAALSEGKA